MLNELINLCEVVFGILRVNTFVVYYGVLSLSLFIWQFACLVALSNYFGSFNIINTVGFTTSKHMVQMREKRFCFENGDG